MTDTPPATRGGDSAAGLAYALAAYLLWGFLPLYMKLVAHVPPVEVVAHRVLWSLPVAGAVLLATGRTADLRAALRSGATLRMAALTAALISVNWAVYVWAIGAGHALDAALGYYINPLVSVALGALVLKERLARSQVAAIALAAVAVAVLTWSSGQVPVVALVLAFSFAGYGYFKKALPIGPNQGFMLEVLILTPLAAGWLVWLGLTGQGHFADSPANALMLVAAGPVTAVPLMVYAHGAKRLRLSTIGVLQYITPTMVFLIAVLAFGEPFPPLRLAAFGLIWAALALYTAGLIRGARRGG